jgi:1-acyl-sn-glycerol-3-phosphate acyltransferase
MVGERLLKSETVDILLSVLFQEMDPDSVDGIDVRMLEKFSPLFDLVSRTYLRMEVEGMDSVPDGKALLVGNHNAGITFIEPMGLGARWYLERGTKDLIQWLVHDAMLAMPGLRTFLVRTGCVRASHQTADEIFERGRKVAVFPGGNLEAFRPYRNRHQIVFGGRKGFLRLALRNQVPIVPFVIVGGHESFYILHDGRQLARWLHLKQLLRSDTCPIFFGLPWGVGVGPIFHLHLPTKSQVRFLDPIELNGFGPADQDNEEVLTHLYDRVTRSMTAAMQAIGAKRRYPVIG